MTLPSAVKAEKAALRQHLRALRAGLVAGLGAQGRQEAAQALAGHLQAWPRWPQVRAVHVYLPLPEEMDTWPLIRACWESGRRVLVPWLPPLPPLHKVGQTQGGQMQGGQMRLAELTPDTPLVPGPMGIAQPAQPLAEPAAQQARPQIDLVLVPGLAFDPQGGRLGYGQGHYDRFLASLPQRPLALGVGFAQQLVAGVPQDPWDIPLVGVLTENGIITATQNR